MSEGRTAAAVASRTKIGKPLTRAVISDLETGRKKTLEVSELLTLAVALNVSPLSLLIPDVLDDVEVLPGYTVPGTEVLSWLLGLGSTGGGALGLLSMRDQTMQLATRIVEVDSLLTVQRINEIQHARGLALAEAGSVGMSDQMKAYEESNLNHVRSQIELLEKERRDLERLYRQRIAERNDA